MRNVAPFNEGALTLFTGLIRHRVALLKSLGLTPVALWKKSLTPAANPLPIPRFSSVWPAACGLPRIGLRLVVSAAGFTIIKLCGLMSFIPFGFLLYIGH